MRTGFKIWIAIVLSIATLSTSASAQQGAKGQARMADKAKALTAQMTTAFSLDGAKSQELSTILAQHFTALKALHKSAGTKEEKRPQALAIRKETDAKITSIIGAANVPAYRKMIKDIRAQRKEARAARAKDMEVEEELL